MLRRLKNHHAFSTVEMAVALGIVVVIITIAALVQVQSLKTARKITLEHDLRLFAELETTQYNTVGHFTGSKGQVIEHNELDSDFQLGGFKPSRDVTIVILSGDPRDPYNPKSPYIIEARHKKLKRTYLYNLTTSKMEEE